jgi:trehalose 6-phosphate synthase complex regulatory subunit
VLIQVALQTTESNELAAGGVVDLVSRINSRFSTLTYQPVVFLHVQDLTFNQYLALLTVADAFIVTSLREGMALRTHEYVECQEGRYRPLLLSEFTGSYSYSGFRSCIPINPWNTKGTADAIHQVGFFLGFFWCCIYTIGGWMLIVLVIGIDYDR